MYYGGIDPSLNSTGLIILDPDHKIVECVTLPKKPTTEIDLEDRIIMLLDQFVPYMEKYKDNIYVNIEGPSYASTGRAVVQIASVNLSFRIYMRRNNIPFEVTQPTALKKLVVGKGNAGKELMLLHVYKKYGEEFDDNNKCDAYGLARVLSDGLVP